MSTKRGRRNGKWHKEKANRRLQEKRDELRQQSYEVEYIPLEKPIFAGWDITMEVTSGRRDAEELEAIAKIMEWSKDFYVKDVKRIKSIRRYGRSYESYIKLRNEYYGYHNFIREDVYSKLPYKLLKYFNTSSHDRWGKVYTLNWNFPFYALSLKIKKSYYYYKRVYNTVAKSEYDKLNDYLYVVDRKTWGSRWRDTYVKSNKASWKNSLKKVVCNQYTPDEIIDNYDKIFKGTNNKREYGWD